MSAIVVICIEGVLCNSDEHPPTASPAFTGLRMAQALSQAWQVGYVSLAPRETAVAWLKEVDAPAWCWVAQATGAERASVILRQLAQRQDRAQLVMAGDLAGFDSLAEHGITTMMVAHASSFALGDWRQESTWDDIEEIDIKDRE